MPPRPPLDLTLYLVTDENPDYLKGKDFFKTVEDAILGGVTIVQYRQKHGTAASRKETATKLLNITRAHNIPLIINDDVETCLAVGAEGLHIGQDDMELEEARSRVGKDVIIGVSVSSVKEAQDALRGGADYLGIGAMFATPTKTDTKSIIGTRGAQDILLRCETGTQHQVPCVAIGSINASTIQRVLHQSSTHSGNRLNGVAVVSAIMASADPKDAARTLRDLKTLTEYVFYASSAPTCDPDKSLKAMLSEVPALVGKHASSKTLSHNMTNTVVQNFAANVCLATGASPIMSLNGEEAADLAALKGGLVVNMGTITPDTMAAYKAGLLAYNGAGNPVVFDPVGGGATSVRRNVIKELMTAGFFDLIKGNEGEITAVMGSSLVQQRGVDSGPSSTTSQQKIKMVTDLARRERCIVLMTGSTDYLSDGTTTYAISNGCNYLGIITGSGCALGSVIASYMATYHAEKLQAALAGILHYEIAAELAASRDSVRGPGSFIPCFLDELYLLPMTLAMDVDGHSGSGLHEFQNRLRVEDVSGQYS